MKWIAGLGRPLRCSLDRDDPKARTNYSIEIATAFLRTLENPRLEWSDGTGGFCFPNRDSIDDMSDKQKALLIIAQIRSVNTSHVNIWRICPSKSQTRTPRSEHSEFMRDRALRIRVGIDLVFSYVLVQSDPAHYCHSPS